MPLSVSSLTMMLIGNLSKPLSSYFSSNQAKQVDLFLMGYAELEAKEISMLNTQKFAISLDFYEIPSIKACLINVCFELQTLTKNIFKNIIKFFVIAPQCSTACNCFFANVVINGSATDFL